MDGKWMPGCVAAAYCVLEGADIPRPVVDELAGLGGEAVLDLVSLANKVRNAYARDAYVCTILNAKSGLCGEDCRFCAQSAHHESVVDEYPLLTVHQIVERARQCHASGVRSFGIVTSGMGFPEPDASFRRILDAIDEIHRRYPALGVCASLGILGEATAEQLARRGIMHYNINLQTNPARYGELIARTHTVESRMRTIELLKANGVGVCSGGILGLGETMSDRVELAYALKDLDVDVIPLNVLVPIRGTPLERQPPTPVVEIAKTFAIFRLLHPRKVIKFAAGRETVMSDFQGLLMLAGANGFLTGGYLTTRGREVAADVEFQKQLAGFQEA
jgi:biotin synthase